MDDKYNYSREYLINRITILLGGRTAEEIVLQQQTTGAGDDLEKATEMARKMVCEWGMSDKLGPLTFGKNEEHIFLGREVARAKDYSEETALAIDGEIKRIVVECAGRAKQILEENIEKLHALARALLERESLDSEEIARILRAQPFTEAPGRLNPRHTISGPSWQASPLATGSGRGDGRDQCQLESFHAGSVPRRRGRARRTRHGGGGCRWWTSARVRRRPTSHRSTRASARRAVELLASFGPFPLTHPWGRPRGPRGRRARHQRRLDLRDPGASHGRRLAMAAPSQARPAATATRRTAIVAGRSASITGDRGRSPSRRTRAGPPVPRANRHRSCIDSSVTSGGVAGVDLACWRTGVQAGGRWRRCALAALGAVLDCLTRPTVSPARWPPPPSPCPGGADPTHDVAETRTPSGGGAGAA
jgi:hypothetical protein